MFDLLDKPLHWIPVKWPSLKAPDDADNLSAPGENEVELRVEILNREEVIWRFPGMFGDERKPMGKPPSGCASKDEPEKWAPTPDEVETFLRVVQDWRKISAKGRRVELNPENARLLLQSPMFGPSFASAYLMAIGGQAEIREKNSPGSPDDGRAESEPSAEPSSAKTANGSE